MCHIVTHCWSTGKPWPPRPERQHREVWYARPGAVKHWFHGVFEGGGAKGVAYAGALSAMAESQCWFEAVAGASAGAITAALIAAGLAPDEIQAKTDLALSQVRTRRWAGLRRLQTATGYYPSDNLRSWLDDVLRTQIKRKTGHRPNTSVTFEDLQKASLIELNIVAADLSMRCHLVFSYLETPKCVGSQKDRTADRLRCSPNPPRN